MSKSFEPGNCLVSWAEFVYGGSSVDPASVFVDVLDPRGDLTTYEHGVDPEVSNPSVGRYEFDCLGADIEGEWFLRWYSSGNYRGSAGLRFTIKESPFF